MFLKKIFALALKILSTPTLMGWALAAISLFALLSAFTAQYGFGLEPCNLCLMQRYPYGAVIILGALTAIFARANKQKIAATLIALSGIIFSGESALAFYHVGVEQHWWKSMFEACNVPDLGSTPEDIIKAIQSKAAVPCDQIPWEMFGISMAGYNVMMAAGLAFVCFASAFLILKKN